MDARWTRRRMLAAATVTAAGLAGCTDGDGDGAGSYGGLGGDGSDDDSDDGSTDDSADLDLREANVTDVAVESAGDGEYRFDVTLHHDDAGEDGYANWWQVETLDGEQLGRRDLAHAHGTEPFTRSETIAVPDDVECVVVRGHDQTHGYGGVAMLVTIESGAQEPRRQGSDPETVADASCP